MVEERGEGIGGGRVAADELRLLIERAERLEEEKKGIADDLKDVWAEAKSRGYDVKAAKRIMAIRKKKREEYQEEEAILDTYLHALGMDFASTPLGSMMEPTPLEQAIDATNTGLDVSQLAAQIQEAGGTIIDGNLVLPMSGLRQLAEAREDTTDEDLYDRAVKLVRSEGKASTSWLQRQLRLGYNSAARLIELMERERIVSKPDGTGKRAVMAPRHDQAPA